MGSDSEEEGGIGDVLEMKMDVVDLCVNSTEVGRIIGCIQISKWIVNEQSIAGAPSEGEGEMWRYNQMTIKPNHIQRSSMTKTLILS
jgi:hypothetical protein